MVTYEVRRSFDRKDTINLDEQYDVIGLLEKLLDIRTVTYTDTLYANGNILKPFHGSQTIQTGFNRYSCKLTNDQVFSNLLLKKDFKSALIYMNSCVSLDDKLKTGIESQFKYIGKRNYQIDGGEEEILKFYCDGSRIIVLMFNQPQSYHSVSPKCNIGQSEDLPVFLKMIGIAELIGFEKHFKALSYKFHDEEILSKINENCR